MPLFSLLIKQKHRVPPDRQCNYTLEYCFTISLTINKQPTPSNFCKPTHPPIPRTHPCTYLSVRTPYIHHIHIQPLISIYPSCMRDKTTPTPIPPTSKTLRPGTQPHILYYVYVLYIIYFLFDFF